MTNIIGETWLRVRPDLSTFRLETQTGVGAALTGLGGGGAAGSALRLGGITAGIAAFVLAAKESIGGAAELEQELNVLEATSRATAEEMVAISAEAKRLGADLELPGVSARDAASAMLELVKGGVDVQDTINAARGVLQLGAAANLEYGESARIVARALTTFRLEGDEATRVSDLLTGASVSATGEVTDMALALQQAGAVAHQAGLSVDETVTAISLLAKNGVLGSDAGTSLRTTLLRLIPTTDEAREIVEALGVGVADAEGNLRSLGAIFDDYRVALDRLTPVQRQQTLETIFGTDAIRAAAIFSQEGAAGFDRMADAVTREGEAARLAAARNEGLKGTTEGLGSQLDTLGTSIGSIAIPALTDLSETAAAVVGDIISVTEAAKDLARQEIFGVSFSDAAREGADIVKDKVFAPFRVARLAIVETADAVEDLNAKIRGLEEPTALTPDVFKFGALSALTGGDLLPEGLLGKDLIEDARAGVRIEGKRLGETLGSGIADGIISAEQEAVNAARSTLRRITDEGRQAVAEAIQQGREAVRLSAIDARSNLISIGQGLAGDAVRLIEEGPLARRIEALRAQLGRSGDRNERRKLDEGLRDAERALRSAQSQAQVAGVLTPAQLAANQRFLEPFRRDVRDAKSALEEFGTESVIEKLEAQATQQKETVQQGIADLIVQFNRGGLSVNAATIGLAKLLERNGVQPYGAAGKRLGLAFVTEFQAELDAATQQILEIARGLQVPEIGLEPTVISPRGERATQDKNVAATRATVAERTLAAQDSLRRATNAATRSTDDLAGTNRDLIAAIRASIPAKRPSTARSGPGSSNDRSGPPR